MRRIATLVVSLACLSACGEPPKPQKADPKDLQNIKPGDAGKAGTESGGIPDPVATINDKPIPASTFREIYDLKVKKYSDRGREIPPSADRRYKKSITERLVYQEILRQEAAARGVEYDKAALAEREEAQKRGIKDWEKHLQRRGETEQSLRDMYIAELQELKLLEASGKLAVTDAEIDEEYEKVKPNYNADKERVHAAHILIPIGPQPQNPHDPAAAEPSDADKAKWREEAMAKAEQVYKLATAPGADFDKLAKENSIGPSADKGGDLGIFTKDRMVEEFSVAAFKLKPGEISKPIETKFGVHIIKCIAKYPPGDLPKEALAEQLRERLYQRKLHQGRRELKDELMAKYKVDNKMEAALGPDPRTTRKGPLKQPGPNAPRPEPEAAEGAPAPEGAGEPGEGTPGAQ